MEMWERNSHLKRQTRSRSGMKICAASVLFLSFERDAGLFLETVRQRGAGKVSFEKRGILYYGKGMLKKFP